MADFATPLSKYIKHEYPDVTYTRETITVGTAANLAAGTVLGKITATGKYVQVNLAAEDGSQNVAGILIRDAAAAESDVESLAITMGPAIATDKIIYPSGATDANKATINAGLKSIGIKVAESI